MPDCRLEQFGPVSHIAYVTNQPGCPGWTSSAHHCCCSAITIVIKITTRSHSESVNLRQAAILNFVESQISCRNYPWSLNICWTVKSGEQILNCDRAITTEYFQYSGCDLELWPWRLDLSDIWHKVFNICDKFQENCSCTLWDITTSIINKQKNQSTNRLDWS